MKIFLLVITIVLIGAQAQAQFSKAIEDNSFLIEEAYNQEDGIVQHIFTGAGGSGRKFNELSFTQEFPLFSQTHQISYTIPYLTSNSLSGIGDIMVNYRYQLTNENGLAVSPRLSVIIPSGDNAQGLGDGVIGMQVNLPVSKRWSNEFITHGNAGFTLLPNVKIGATTETQTSYFVGVSGIYLVNEHFNVLLETLYSFGNGAGEFILNPGIRYAIDIGELQIVPGLAITQIFTPGRKESGAFLYLSFEHPL